MALLRPILSQRAETNGRDARDRTKYQWSYAMNIGLAEALCVKSLLWKAAEAKSKSDPRAAQVIAELAQFWDGICAKLSPEKGEAWRGS